MSRRKLDDVNIDMTPMIDIVFQLLTFFVMTFKIAQAEGDFQITMPSGRVIGPQPDFPPLKVTLTADATGALERIRMGDRSYASFHELHRAVAALVGPDRGPGGVQATVEVELDCDAGLKYEHTIAAITAVAGEVGPGGAPIRLIDKIRFTPPKRK